MGRMDAIHGFEDRCEDPGVPHDQHTGMGFVADRTVVASSGFVIIGPRTPPAATNIVAAPVGALESQ